MNQNKEKLTNLITIFGISLLLLCFFWQMKAVFFGAEEEYELFCTVQKGDFKLWLDLVTQQTGRVTFYILSPFWAGPMAISNPLGYKLCMYLLIVVDLLVVFRLLYKHVDKQFAYLTTAVLVLFFQISQQHNLLISYNYLHVAFICILLSAHCILDYCRGYKGKKALYLSAGLSFFACFFQENFILFYVLDYFIVLAFQKDKSFWKKVWSSFKLLCWHVLGGLVFLAIYFGFRSLNGGSQYGGNSFRLDDLEGSLRTLFMFITGMFPGRTFFRVEGETSFEFLLTYMEPENIIISIFGGILVGWILYRVKEIKHKGAAVAFCLLGSFLSCALHAVSEQYLNWVDSGYTYAYVPSYYCYFFLGIILCIVVVTIKERLPKGKVVYCIAIAGICTVVAFGTQLTNNYYRTKYAYKWGHYEAYREFFEECPMEEWNPDTQILIEDEYTEVNALIVKHTATITWYDAFGFNITTNPAEIDMTQPYYILNFKGGEIYLEYQEVN